MSSRLAPLLAMFLAGCGSREDSAAPRRDAAPGEEPLETVSLAEEEVVPLEPEKAAATGAGRPCAWARAWESPAAPRPLLAGVGGAPNPTKTVDAPIAIPAREPSPSGEIIVEIVVAPDGSVSEAAVVRSTDPPWPQAEERILAAVRKWRYEPPLFDGTPIAVCTTVVIHP